MRLDALHYRCGDYRIDVANRRFLRDETELPLEPRVFAVIVQLLARNGALVSRNDLLDAIWGHRYVTPSALNRTIALARRAFGDDVAEPRFIQTVHGAGYRYVGPIEPLQAGDLPVRTRFGPPFLARIPARIETLIGREQELAALRALLQSRRAVTLLGAGGMGKTQCALEAARRAAAEFPDGVWFFDLAPLQHAGEWLTQLGSALEVRSPLPETVLQQSCALLQSRRALFVLDNCEGIAVDLGALVHQLLRATESVSVLATSQRALNFTGEHLYRLPPLQVPEGSGARDQTPEATLHAAAMQLLVTRIQAVRPDFEVGADNAGALAEICRRLDGMPLALELAAARFALLSADQVLERLLQRFRFLESNSTGRQDRHRSLRNLLDWSYALLTTDERRLLNWSAVFVQSWSTEAFGVMAASLGHDPQTTIDLLSGLVSHSVVTVVTDVVPPRFRLLESVREYALLQLRSSGEQEAAHAAHLAAMVQVCAAARIDMLRGRMRETIERLSLEHGNIQSALDAASRHGVEHPQALEVLGSLLLWAKAHGDYLTMMRWCRQVVDPTSDRDTIGRARALLTLGVVQVHLAQADIWMPDALAIAARIAHQHEDAWTEAYASGFLALRHVNENRAAEAEQHALRLEALLDACNDDLLRGLAGLVRGWICIAWGRHDAALAVLGAARELGPDLHQQHFIGMYVGLAHYALGRIQGAAQAWLTSLRVCSSVANIRGMAGSLEGCSYLACWNGRWSAAARLRAAALAIRERTRVPLFNFWLPHHQATLAMLQAQMPAPELAEATRTGAAMRLEDATDAALALLEEFAQTSPATGGAQPEAKRPSGS